MDITRSGSQASEKGPADCPTTAMTHIAIQERLNGTPVEWMERVTDEQYRGDMKSAVPAEALSR